MIETEKPEPELEEFFKAAFYTNGRMIVKCDVCDTVHFCVDDPSLPLPSLLAVEFTGVELENPGDRAELNKAIRSFDLQADNGINACYHPFRLVAMLMAAEAPPVPFGNVHQDNIEIAFRCGPGDAVDQINRAHIEIENYRWATEIHIADNIACGTLNGKQIVEGCCEDHLEDARQMVWEDRRKITDFYLRTNGRRLFEAEREFMVANAAASAIRTNE